jgi:Domain of unknown function (DUF932)
MEDSMEVHKFESLKDFEGVVDSLDTYQRMPLYAKDELGQEISSKRVYGMVNMAKRRVTMAVGPEYPVFGHKEAYGLVISDLKAKRIDRIHGKVEVQGDRTYATVLFDDLKVVNDGKDGVELGISFNNPMDRKTSFKGSGYTWRQICSNGAGVKTLLPNLEISERHTTYMLHSLPAIMDRFVEESLKQTNHLQQLVDTAMKERIKFESREQLEATVGLEFEGVSEKHMKAVLVGLPGLEPTRWDMFNATTYYTSHTAISLDIRERIDTIAERFINTDIAIKPVPIVRRPQLEENEE